MIRIRQGEVVKILAQRPEITEILVNVDGRHQRAVNYDHLTGTVQVGDTVVLNTTAVHKKLGTGGSHFVMANLNQQSTDPPEAGHIMKLRYTPCQVKVLSVEEDDSPYSQVMKQITSLEGMPVVAATLHSMLPAAAAALHRLGRGRWRVAYIMTDGAALPIALSSMVKLLKEKKIIHHTITCGHAFGGDLEAVNIYSALLAAKAVAKADVAVVAMGPGIVGTGSKYGYTGLEQGQVVNAVHTLGGRAVAVPRISFADRRERHRGLSHHTGTALGDVALARCTVALPRLEGEKKALVEQQLKTSGISEKHDIIEVDATPAIEALREAGINVTTMGRTIEQDREFFLAAGAAGVVAARFLNK
ncbi:hypothetical protein JOC37_001082 [Desulfohalotomaculum tongense]|uniref:DUF3866 family protein n=1 Tax=Desulforadius tongensis TaxID=1216062 RepID=UPI00195DBE07|nr:DUF3866 family protein [Desulforadius tongensis]MBM7854704.1 hypothetical protein [Desulforadius tongensis]